MDDDHNDDYPLLDFLLPDDLGNGSIYAEDQVVFGPDGPELGPIEDLWNNDVDDDDDDDDFYEPYPQPEEDEEEFYVIDPRELSCCYEEWEDYC